MKTLLNTLLFLIVLIEANAQTKPKPSWVDGQLPQKKNTIFFSGEGKDKKEASAKILAKTEALKKIVDRNGLEVSYEVIKVLVSETQGDKITKEKDSLESTTKIIGKKVGIKGLWLEDEWSIQKDTTYTQHYLYSIPDYNVGALALIPSAAQYARKENTKAILMTIGTGLVIGGPVFYTHANNLQAKAQLYNTNPVYYRQYQSKVRWALAGSYTSFGIAIGTYIWSAIDGFSKNKLSSKSLAVNKNFRLRPYSTINHSGLTLSIALNK